MKKYLICVILLLSSCQSKEKILRQNFNSSWNEYFEKSYDKTSQIDIFVVTNRNKLSNEFSCKEGAFGSDLSTRIIIGRCNINVPKNYKIGYIPEIVSDLGMLHKDFKILQEESFEQNDLVAKIKDTKRNPLIFVHGFNVGFNEAVARSAQIAHDLKYQGPVILFSWPAGGDDSSVVEIDKVYKSNFKNAKLAINDFVEFLVLLKNNDITPNIMVHSMGHQTVLNGLNSLAKKYPKDEFVNKLILNAPDFEVEKFVAMKEPLQKVADNITIYCASNDKAISVSRAINGSKRLGECVMLDAKVDTKIDLIDVTKVNISLLGHGYYYSREVLNDIFQNLVGIEAKKRIFIVEKDFYEGQYYLRK